MQTWAQNPRETGKLQATADWISTKGKKLSELFLNPGTGCPHWISLSTHLFSVLTHNISRCRVKQEKNLPAHDFFFFKSWSESRISGAGGGKGLITFTRGTTIPTFHCLWNLSASLFLSLKTALPGFKHHNSVIRSHVSHVR